MLSGRPAAVPVSAVCGWNMTYWYQCSSSLTNVGMFMTRRYIILLPYVSLFWIFHVPRWALVRLAPSPRHMPKWSTQRKSMHYILVYMVEKSWGDLLLCLSLPLFQSTKQENRNEKEVTPWVPGNLCGMCKAVYGHPSMETRHAHCYRLSAHHYGCFETGSDSRFMVTTISDSTYHYQLGVIVFSQKFITFHMILN